MGISVQYKVAIRSWQVLLSHPEFTKVLAFWPISALQLEVSPSGAWFKKHVFKFYSKQSPKTYFKKFLCSIPKLLNAVLPAAKVSLKQLGTAQEDSPLPPSGSQCRGSQSLTLTLLSSLWHMWSNGKSCGLKREKGNGDTNCTTINSLPAQSHWELSHCRYESNFWLKLYLWQQQETTP